MIMSEKAENIRKYDNYIYSTLKCFVKHKQELKFGMVWLSGGNVDVLNLIMGELVEIDPRKEDIVKMKGMINDKNDINLPKKQVLTIFYNVQRLSLDLSGKIRVNLSLLSLSIIKSHASLKMVTIKLGYPKYNDIIYSLYALSKEMKRKYENVGYNIHLEERQTANDRVWIFCVIERKS